MSSADSPGEEHPAERYIGGGNMKRLHCTEALGVHNYTSYLPQERTRMLTSTTATQLYAMSYRDGMVPSAY